MSINDEIEIEMARCYPWAFGTGKAQVEEFRQKENMPPLDWEREYYQRWRAEIGERLASQPPVNISAVPESFPPGTKVIFETEENSDGTRKITRRYIRFPDGVLRELSIAPAKMGH